MCFNCSNLSRALGIEGMWLRLAVSFLPWTESPQGRQIAHLEIIHRQASAHFPFILISKRKEIG